MYCSSCGVAVTPGLTYCNRCGTKLSAANDDHGKPSQVRPEFLVFAMIATFVFGLVAITMLMGVMKVVLQLDVGQVFPFAVLSFLLMLLLEGVFITLLFRRGRGDEKADDARQLKRATRELDSVQPQILPETRASVTEHTTRAFEPIYREPTSK